jgi:hypothetical protein
MLSCHMAHIDLECLRIQQTYSLNILKIKLTSITTDAGHDLCYSTCIPSTSVESLHSHTSTETHNNCSVIFWGAQKNLIVFQNAR